MRRAPLRHKEPASEVKAGPGLGSEEEKLPGIRLHRKQVGNSTLLKRDSACVEFKSVRSLSPDAAFSDVN
ncbi:hypothetical protein PGIGA_G00060200 [Pangasianodon gigas]|uniref:Uncharacterized protein n=1 Tax=Pangasianodon gigas TaxID=30993 RepID=A0ACC5X5D0_PANGG|nr:hypothetical protein [Pangasianodon gigas]